MNLLTRLKCKLVYTGLRTMPLEARSGFFPALVQEFFRDNSYGLGPPSLSGSLENLRTQGLSPAFIVDIGAYHGNWTREVATIFPQADFLLIDANPEQQQFLAEAVKDLRSHAEYWKSLQRILG